MQKSGETVEEQDNIGARDKEEDLERWLGYRLAYLRRRLRSGEN